MLPLPPAHQICSPAVTQGHPKQHWKPQIQISFISFFPHQFSAHQPPAASPELAGYTHAGCQHRSPLALLPAGRWVLQLPPWRESSECLAGQSLMRRGSNVPTHTNDNTGHLAAQPHLLQTPCWPGLTFTHSLTQATKEHVVLWQSKRGTVLVQCWLQRQQVSYSQGSSIWDPSMPFPVLNLSVCTMLIKPMPGTSSTALQLNMQQGHYCHLWQHGD